MSDDPGRVTALVSLETGYDVDGMLKENDDIPKRIFSLRQQISPLLAEKRAIDARYIAKGRSTSLWDVERGILLSELKEEARVLYNRDPDFKEDAKGNQTKIELTDGRAEDIARGHPRYRKMIEESRDERKRAATLGKELSKLFDKLEAWKRRADALKIKLEQIKAETYLLNGQLKL